MTGAHNSTLNILCQIYYFHWENPKFLFWTSLNTVPNDKKRDGSRNVSLLAIQPHDMAASLRIFTEDTSHLNVHIIYIVQGK